MVKRDYFIPPENAFPLLQSFTPLQSTIRQGVRLLGHFMKLPTNSFCADAVRNSVEGCNQGQSIFICYPLQHLTVLFCELVWLPTSVVPLAYLAYHFSTRQSCSVRLCGLPLHGRPVVTPRSFHFTITALTVDRGSSSRAEILQTDLLESWRPMTVLCWKSLSSSVKSSMFVYGDCMAVCSISYTCKQRVWLK